jgi:hypothetical protein
MKDIPDWSNAAKNLKPGIYRHFKGDEYELIKVARNSETIEEVVVYQSLKYPDRVWVRPLAMFVEEVDRDGYQGPRFEFVREG